MAKPATPKKDTFAVDLYPAPLIKWHPSVEQHESLVMDAEKRGLINKPKPVHTRSTSNTTTKIGSQDEELTVRLKAAIALEPPVEPSGGYRATAFYQSEGLEPRERRKCQPKQAAESKYGKKMHDCFLEAQFRIPYNSREQFVKVAVYAVADGADVPVGEATVPIADPKAETMTGWRLMQDFEETGEVELQVVFPGDDVSVAETADKSTESYDLEAKYASVASKSVVESVGELQSKQDSAESMVPEPTSHMSDTPVEKGVESMDASFFALNSGDRAQVYSKSSGAWVVASIVHVDHARGEVIVQHGEHRKVVNLRSHNLAEFFRPWEALDSPSLSGVRLGSGVEVYSQSAGRWSAGEVSRVDLQRQEVSVEYENRVKTVKMAATDLEKYFRQKQEDVPSSPTTPAAKIPQNGVQGLQDQTPAMPVAAPATAGLQPETVPGAVSGAGVRQIPVAVAQPCQPQCQAVLKREITPQTGLMPVAAVPAQVVSPGCITYTAPQGFTYRVEAPVAQWVGAPAMPNYVDAKPQFSPAYTVATHPAPAWATGRPA